MKLLELNNILHNIWEKSCDLTDDWWEQQPESKATPNAIGNAMIMAYFHQILHSIIYTTDYSEDIQDKLWEMGKKLLAQSEDKRIPEA